MNQPSTTPSLPAAPPSPSEGNCGQGETTSPPSPTPTRLHPPPGSDQRVAGLDTLRGVLALTVFLFHRAMPPLMSGYDQSNPVLRKLNALWEWSLNGQLAVVAFFLISGFCIHYPYLKRPLFVPAFYANRCLRLALPAFAAIVLTWLTGMVKPFSPNGVPIWSLWCELLYYLFYPAFLPLIKKGRLPALLAGSFAGAVLVLALSESHTYYHEFGWWQTTLIGLPVWLLGAFLAEKVSGRPIIASGKTLLWFTRTLVLAASLVTLSLSYANFLGLGWSLTLASPLLYLWIRQEISHYTTRPEPRLLALVGGMSYSIYLVHQLILHMLAKAPLDKLGANLAWSLKIICVLGFSYGFYALIERPSHRFSRNTGSWVGKRLARTK